MCLAYPGKITNIKNEIATIDYGSETRKARIVMPSEINYLVGDYVIVMGKVVIEKVPEKKAKEFISMFSKNQ